MPCRQTYLRIDPHRELLVIFISRALAFGRNIAMRCIALAGPSGTGGLETPPRGSGLWRTDRDSNPGYLAVYTLSKRAPSATRPSVRSNAGQPSNFTTKGKQGRPRRRRPQFATRNRAKHPDSQLETHRKVVIGCPLLTMSSGRHQFMIYLNDRRQLMLWVRSLEMSDNTYSVYLLRLVIIPALL